MKPGSTSEKEYLLNQLNAIEKTLKKQFGETYKQAINLGEIRNVINSGDSFSFSNNPSAKKKVDSMLKTLQGNLTNTVSQYSQTIGRVATQTAKDGVKASVNPSKKEQDFVDKLSDDAMKDARKSASESAGEAKMSSSVWNFGDYSKKEIQAIINAGIRKGLTVQGIADSVTPYLNNPLLEDAEPEFQKIQTPKGVYKSAYKNALRLARTEVMRAYDEAEWNSYQNDPMVVGFEVKTSNNHTVLIHGKRVPLKDMCDQLAGKYPKSFKFTGWHPQCRCTMLPITIGTDELGDLMEAQENGEEFVSKNTISELPENFNQWYDSNKDRFNANNEPWFLSENKEIIENEGLINISEETDLIAQEKSLFDKDIKESSGSDSYEKLTDEQKDQVVSKAIDVLSEALNTKNPTSALKKQLRHFELYGFGGNRFAGWTLRDYLRDKINSLSTRGVLVDGWTRGETLLNQSKTSNTNKATNSTQEPYIDASLEWKDEDSTMQQKVDVYLKHCKADSITPVSLPRKLSDKQIAQRLGGFEKGDAEGSCASLAMAYMANKMGLDVLDQRGGKSREFFSFNMASILRTMGGESCPCEGSTMFSSIRDKINASEEYVLSAGSHMSVIKKEGNDVYYLELQDESKECGYRLLDQSILDRRFGGVSYCHSFIVIDFKTLEKNKKTVKEICSLLNTKKSDRKVATSFKNLFK